VSKAFDFCIPTRGTKVRTHRIGSTKSNTTAIGCAWSATAVGAAVHPTTDWTKRYPWIVESALTNPQKQFVIDGDAVIRASMADQTSMRSFRIMMKYVRSLFIGGYSAFEEGQD
jgi:hypothetical protein